MSGEDVDVILLRMTVGNFRKLPQIARRVSCKIHITKKIGFPFFVYRFRKRKLLVSGCIAFCMAAWLFTGFVWVIDIDGFEGLDAEELRRNLREHGLKRGTLAMLVDEEKLKNDILIEMPEISYISVNLNGAHASVTVKKRVLPPAILSKEVPCDIVADKDGVISSIVVKSGTPEVARGDAVVKGQLLASGYMTGRAGTTIITHADADIRVKTWQKISARMMKKYGRKVYSGKEKNIYTIILPKRRIKLSLNSGISYTKCDKIIRTTDLEFFGGIKLPLSLECATYREYKIEPAVMADSEAFKILGTEVHSAVLTEEGALMTDSEFLTSADSEFAYATLTAEFDEPIGEERKILLNG
jgi:similar to stage IV sporulation protein